MWRIAERGSTPGREVRAGVTTFLTMAYILVVNPQILAQAGMPAADVAAATALAAAVGSLAMALLANYPFALAPGMGLNAYFVFGVVLGLGVSWQVALTAVLIEGILFLLLSLVGVRAALVDSVPVDLRRAIPVGIGLFLAVLGLQAGGVVVADPATLLSLGDLHAPSVGLTLLGLAAVGPLLARRVPGALLVVILGIAALAWIGGVAPAPERWLAPPRLPDQTWLAVDFSSLGSGAVLTAMLAFLMVDLLDTAGTLVGVGQLGGFTDDEGRLPRADRAFAADALATIAGALFGTSTTTTYVESAAGVEEGGRTGLTAVVVAILFLLSLAFAPLFTAIPAVATAPALVAVGAMMMRGVGRIDWRSPEEALPAFLTVTLMPFTFSIANGLAAGIVSWVAIRVLTGRWRQVGPTLWVLTVAVALFYGWLHG